MKTGLLHALSIAALLAAGPVHTAGNQAIELLRR